MVHQTRADNSEWHSRQQYKLVMIVTPMNKCRTEYQDEQSSPHQLHNYKSRGQSAAWADY
jgi:hypothetical protein